MHSCSRSSPARVSRARCERSPRAADRRGRSLALARFGAADPEAARVAEMLELAQRFGTPLAQALAVEAATLRAERRRAAEARARRLPVLILFPMTLCVLPALLILFLGPPVLSFLN